MRYKPVGWNKVYANAKDKDENKDKHGCYTGVVYGALSCLVNSKQLPAKASGFKGTDPLKPALKNELILTYHSNEDAVLFGAPGFGRRVTGGDCLTSVAVGGGARPNGTQAFSDTDPSAFARFMADRSAGASPGDPQNTLGTTPGAF
ncbi:hypothetical protein ACIRU8_40705 [Streptomyces sp. NPDC101175]|uniref:hypothetical protein n=1 Tax=Streptomyces sp. NPDC101175 TaxID=3366123 RepID=UPI00383646A3